MNECGPSVWWAEKERTAGAEWTAEAWGSRILCDFVCVKSWKTLPVTEHVRGWQTRELWGDTSVLYRDSGDYVTPPHQTTLEMDGFTVCKIYFNKARFVKRWQDCEWKHENHKEGRWWRRRRGLGFGSWLLGRGVLSLGGHLGVDWLGHVVTTLKTPLGSFSLR